jgi:hypothetical protein
MRTYLAGDVAALERLRDGESVSLPGFPAASEDELDEFAAMSDAAEAGDVVVAADVDAADQPITLEQVASFHLDADGSGDLAWYATQELDQVVAALIGQGRPT